MKSLIDIQHIFYLSHFVGYQGSLCCNQCLSPRKLWVLIVLMARCSQYNSMW